MDARRLLRFRSALRALKILPPCPDLIDPPREVLEDDSASRLVWRLRHEAVHLAAKLALVLERLDDLLADPRSLAVVRHEVEALLHMAQTVNMPLKVLHHIRGYRSVVSAASDLPEPAHRPPTSCRSPMPPAAPARRISDGELCRP